MITAEMRAEMRRLVLVEGWRIQTVARRFGVHHSVVRRKLTGFHQLLHQGGDFLVPGCDLRFNLRDAHPQRATLLF
jgi:transposase-like protein